MRVMANADRIEEIALPDASLTNTKDIDSYFGNVIDGWDTDVIMIFRKNHNFDNNVLVGCWSAYASTIGLVQVYRSTLNNIVNITRNDWGVNTYKGDKYYVCRFWTANS